LPRGLYRCILILFADKENIMRGLWFTAVMVGVTLAPFAAHASKIIGNG